MKVYFIWVGWEKLYKLNYNIPPLGVLRVAGETPATIPIFFTDETVSPIDFDSDAQIIALSFLTPAAGRAAAIAKRLGSGGNTSWSAAPTRRSSPSSARNTRTRSSSARRTV